MRSSRTGWSRARFAPSALVELSGYDAATSNEGVFDETFRRLVPLEPGDALVFHPLLAHGSGVNRSERQRRLVTLWYRGGGPEASSTRGAGRTPRPLR